MNKLLSVSLTVAILVITFSSCRKQHDESTKPDGQVKFSISASQLKNAMELVSDSGVSTGITSIVITIEDLEGNDVKSLEKIELYNMNGYYISKPIALPTGGYILNEFLVLNGKNQVVYAAPLAGSPKDNLVENPLPLSFTITKDSVTKLIPEVVSTTESNPSDFGYNTFSFEVAETFDFLVGVFVYNDLTKNFELTTASIKIWNDTSVVYSGALKANQSETTQLNYDSLGITNKITLPERYNNYILEITKTGYIAYRDTFAKEELRLYNRNEDNGPLVVILKEKPFQSEGLVAYYPFDGNLNDVSGNGRNGTEQGTIEFLDGIFNKSIHLQGEYSTNTFNYATFPNSVTNLDYTISFWYKVYTDNNANEAILFQGDTNYWMDAGLYIHISGSKIAVIQNSQDTRTVGYVKNGAGTPLNQTYLNLPKLSKDIYYFITVTYTNKTVTVYINGIKYSEYEGINEVPLSNAPIKLGVSNLPIYPYIWYQMTGELDDLRIYNRALSQQEISELYNE